MPAEKDTKGAGDKDGEKEAPIRALDAQDIAFLKNYGLGPYATSIKKAEADLKDIMKRVNDLCGVKESDTGLAPPSRWDLVSDKQMMQEEQPLQVHGRHGCMKHGCYLSVHERLLCLAGLGRGAGSDLGCQRR